MKNRILAFFLIFALASIVSFASKKSTVAFIETSHGEIVITLLDETPLHLQNFIKRVDEKFYEGILFHRVIKKFVIQAGDPTTKQSESSRALYGEGSYGEKVAPEFVNGIHHTIGAVGMAREGDDVNPERLSSGSHFYIVQGKNKVTAKMIEDAEESLGYKYSAEVRQSYLRDGGQPRLDGKYVVFGYVLDGMETVDKIADVPKNSKDVPFQNIVIKKIKIKQMTDKELEKKYSYYAK